MRGKKSALTSSPTAGPANLPLKICAPPERLREGPCCSDYGCTDRACGFEVPAADPSARGIFYLAAIATKKVTTLQVNKPLTIAGRKRNASAKRHNAVQAARPKYRARSWWGRLKYRLCRHPLVMFGVGPAYLFLLQHRLPVGLIRDGWRPWGQHNGNQSRHRPDRRRAHVVHRH